MRLIKFRHWDGRKMCHTSKMVYDPGCGTMLADNCFLPIAVMQSTGLTDKNGREIWEGDLIRCVAKNEFSESSGVYEVKFDREFKFSACKPEDDFGYPLTWGGWLFMKVIGNIYDNPELLTKDQ